MKKLIIAAVLILSVLSASAAGDKPMPKREFRGTWMHTVGNEYFRNLTPDQWRDTIADQLDLYQRAGINVIIFQVRPEADAFYISEIEPWSRYLTGEQGKAPDPLFDPMEYVIEECHKRGMEFHAWINPYRANLNVKNPLCENHLYRTKRYLFVNYGSKTWFDPGYPENRAYICRVVKDIVTRYDLDAIHMDDYFYPYPERGMKFRDERSFNKFASADGFSSTQKNDWRRSNVNKLIKELSDTIKSVKPWVRFGISPFGIYRNKSQFEGGSETNGLSNYDDLYADIMLWMNEGWIDYCIPQLYWEIGHSRADFETLAKWWAGADSTDVHLYIGMDVNRSFKELWRKMEISRELPQVEGNCFWSGLMLLDNPGEVRDSLRLDYHRKPALLPEYKNIDSTGVASPYGLELDLMAKGAPVLSWQHIKRDEGGPERTAYYVVYAFDPAEPVDISKAENIVQITTENHISLPDDVRALCSKFVVTAVNRIHTESWPSEAYQAE